mgnify:CR=1 FL=1
MLPVSLSFQRPLEFGFPFFQKSAGAFFGIFPDTLATMLVNPTVASIVGSVEPAKELKLWAGVNTALLLSLAIIATVPGFLIGASIPFVNEWGT